MPRVKQIFFIDWAETGYHTVKLGNLSPTTAYMSATVARIVQREPLHATGSTTRKKHGNSNVSPYLTST